MDLEEIGINTRNLVDLAQDRDYLRALVNVGFISHGVIYIIIRSTSIYAQF